MPDLSALAAFGVWPALPMTGYWLFLRAYRKSGTSAFPLVTSIALACVAGIAVWSVPMLASAVLGAYWAGFFGLLGWAITLFTAKEIFRQSALALRARPHPTGWDGTLALGLVLAAVLYLGFPQEAIYGGRDEGVYSNHGIYIAHHGRLDIPYPWPNTLEPIFSPGFALYQGFYPTRPTMTVQFAHLFPVWLAQAFSTFGHHGLFRLNSMFALLLLAIFYGTSRLAVPKPVAVVATVFLALNPSEIWMARSSLSEILAQLFVWSGLFLLLNGLKAGNHALMRWAGVFLGLSAFVRIDSLLLVPLLFLSHLALRIVKDPTSQDSPSIWRSLYETSLPAFALAVGYYASFSAIYFAGLAPDLRIIGVVMVVALIALLATTSRTVRTLRPWLTSNAVLISLGVALLALTVFAYWIRPSGLPEDLFAAAGASRERSLVNLAQYLSFPVVPMAVLGWYVSLWAVARNRQHPGLIPALVLIAGVSVLYLWNPRVSPGHFWAIRRFIPVVIPGFVFCAAIGARWILGKLPERRAIPVSHLIIIFLGVFTIRADAVILTFAENRGYFNQLRQLAERLPTDEIVLASGDDTWVTPLYVAFDRRVIPIKLESHSGKDILRNWIVTQIDQKKPVYLLSESTWRLPGLQKSKVHGVVLSRFQSEQTLEPLPKRIVTKRKLISLYRITGASSSADYRDVPLGAEMAWGIEESGFHHQEWRSNVPVRWTNGAGGLVVPVDEKRPPRALAVALDSPLPNGTHLRILVNDQTLFNEQIPAGFWSKTFSLARIRLGKRASIKLLSDTFIPRNSMASSQDARRLGVLVYQVALMKGDNALSEAPLSGTGYRSQLKFTITVSPDRVIPLKVTVRNMGKDPWPVLLDPGQQKGRVNVGILWFSRGNFATPLAEHRSELPYAMFTNDEVEIDVPLNPIGYDGKRLPPGIYEVWIGLVQESVTWFFEKGDDVLKLTVEVRP